MNFFHAMEWDQQVFLRKVLQEYATDDVIIRENLIKFTKTGNPDEKDAIIESSVDTLLEMFAAEEITVEDLIETYQEEYLTNPDSLRKELKNHGFVEVVTYSSELFINSGKLEQLSGVYLFQNTLMNDSPTYKLENGELVLWKYKMKQKKNKEISLWMISRQDHVGTQNAYACIRSTTQDPREILKDKTWLIWKSGKFIPDDTFQLDEKNDSWENPLF